MTPRDWTTTGCVLMAVTTCLAALSALLVATSIEHDPVVALSGEGIHPLPTANIHLTGFVGGVVAAVLAGATFFLGLAAFFWSASLRRQAVLEEILRRLPEPPPDT
ncbi:hypothetical protein DZF91_19335 [Actinomadura logoneensis]|uniref:Uncharacterized protein n=1 Tax=Actinomadura logoneensis TaxID=2293572 RepID=A0A372JJ19_9ACTN|nr:hypothetical protein [Actinomadura logoneensis]RFU40013.1 hypothetical protein DZF91_19335 [Actinomadura logoneensis]